MKNLFLALLSLVVFSISSDIYAANIKKCVQKNYTDGVSKLYCTISLDNGRAGDRIVVLNSKAQEIANGRIISRKNNSPYAVILVTNADEEIRKNYPVMIEVSLSDDNIPSSKKPKILMYSYNSYNFN